MARKTSPTHKVSEPEGQGERQNVTQSRQKTMTGKDKTSSRALENSHSSGVNSQSIQEQLAQREAELAIINSIQTALASKLDFQGIIDAVGDKLSEIFEDGNVGIGLADNARNVAILPYVVENGKRVEYFEVSLDTPSVIQHVLKRRRPILINTKFRERFGGDAAIPFPGRDQRDLKSWLGVPIFNGDEVIGGISLRNWRENAYTDSDVRLLQTVANSMSVALENARLFDETQRLLKQTEQRATELQIINNIGQTLTEGGDLNRMIQRVGERIQEALNVKDIVISLFDEKTSRVIAPYMVRNGKQIEITEENIDLKRFKLGIRASARAGGRSWVVNKVVEKTWRKWWISMVDDEVPKSFVTLPLLAGREVIGGITIADYEKENAFTDLSVGLLETIASNMGTAVQNVRLFDETKRLFEEAEEARAAAEHANKAKSTFLANMSHELRTPLNAIMGFTSIVRRKAEGVLPEKQTENLDKVLSSSQHLLGLINTALDIAKIEAGRMDVIPAKFNLSGLVDQCANLATPLLKPNVNLEKQVDETIGIIYSDQDKIKQIVLNLLSNAAKFTHDGRILLCVEKFNAENVNISVTDSGIGISEEAMGRVFEEFQQADNTTTRQYGGTGLGLAISRNLARLLGGDLTATSDLGKGSTFTLTIPIQYEKKPAVSSDPEPDTVQPTQSHAQAGAEASNL
jgi:signal transduction histidine kinase